MTASPAELGHPLLAQFRPVSIAHHDVGDLASVMLLEIVKHLEHGTLGVLAPCRQKHGLDQHDAPITSTAKTTIYFQRMRLEA